MFTVIQGVNEIGSDGGVPVEWNKNRKLRD